VAAVRSLLLALRTNVVFHLLPLANVSVSLTLIGELVAYHGARLAIGHAPIAIIYSSLPLVELSVPAVDRLLAE
jgi:hypothetical protein